MSTPMYDPRWETHVNCVITKDKVRAAEQCLVDNGIQKGEEDVVLRALGYILLDSELYQEE